MQSVAKSKATAEDGKSVLRDEESQQGTRNKGFLLTKPEMKQRLLEDKRDIATENHSSLLAPKLVNY